MKQIEASPCKQKWELCKNIVVDDYLTMPGKAERLNGLDVGLCASLLGCPMGKEKCATLGKRDGPGTWHTG